MSCGATEEKHAFILLINRHLVRESSLLWCVYQFVAVVRDEDLSLIQPSILPK